MANKKSGDFSIGQYSSDVRNALAKLSAEYITGDGLKTLRADLDSMRPVDRAQVMERFLKFWLPTMGTISVKGGQDGDEPIEIKVTYTAVTPKDDDDDTEIDYSEKI